MLLLLKSMETESVVLPFGVAPMINYSTIINTIFKKQAILNTFLILLQIYYGAVNSRLGGRVAAAIQNIDKFRQKCYHKNDGA